MSDLIIHNACIYTVDPKQPFAQALLIESGLIQKVGSNQEILAFKNDSTKVIDAKNHLVLPGLIDSHGHLMGMGRVHSQLNLKAVKSVEELIFMIQRKAKFMSGQQWILGRGWNDHLWENPDRLHRHLLDKVSEKYPLYLVRVDGHAAWVNSKALEMAGIDKSSSDPKGGKIVKDKQGVPTGLLIDNAMKLVKSLIPDPSREDKIKYLKLGMQECLKNGITSFHEADTDPEMLELLDKLEQENELPIRVNCLLSGIDFDKFKKSYLESATTKPFLRAKSIKLYVDGALGSKGAYLTKPYQDDDYGLLLLTEEEVKNWAKKASELGFQLCCHAIGDAANNIILNALEDELGPEVNSLRFRIEHAQLVQKSDILRFKNSHIIAAMQPGHCTSDMLWIDDVLGHTRAKELGYLWKDFIEQEVVISFGSDVPIEPVSPFIGIYSAVTRKNPIQKELASFDSDQCLSREETLKCYTINGAYSSFEESSKGSLEVGKYADLVIISENLLECEAEKILDAKIMLTAVGGEVKFEQEGFCGK